MILSSLTVGAAGVDSCFFYSFALAKNDAIISLPCVVAGSCATVSYSYFFKSSFTFASNSSISCLATYDTLTFGCVTSNLSSSTYMFNCSSIFVSASGAESVTSESSDSESHLRARQSPLGRRQCQD